VYAPPRPAVTGPDRDSVLAAGTEHALDLLRVLTYREELVDVARRARGVTLVEPRARREQLLHLRAHGVELREARLEIRPGLAFAAAVEALANGRDPQTWVRRRVWHVHDARAVEVVRHRHEHSVSALIRHDVVAALRALRTRCRGPVRVA